MTPDRLRAVKMLASTMQISNNNPTNPHTPTNVETQAKRGTEAQPHTHPRQHGQVMTADPSGPNSVLDPTPTNAGHE